MSNMSKFVTVLIGLLLMAFIVSWEFFLFVVGEAGARSHLWLALGAGISACIAASLMFRFFSRYEKTKWSKVEMTPTGPLLAALGGNAFINLPPSLPFDGERWALANAWITEGQADDRTPMDGSVADSGENSVRPARICPPYSSIKFKKWSQARHD